MPKFSAAFLTQNFHRRHESMLMRYALRKAIAVERNSRKVAAGEPYSVREYLPTLHHS